MVQENAQMNTFWNDILINIIPNEDVINGETVLEMLVVLVVVDDGVGDTVKLPVWIIPIVIVEPITSVITCKVYVRTPFGCKSDKLKIPSVAFSYNTGDEGSMTGESVIINSISEFSSSLTTQSAVVYSMIADVLVTSVTCTSLSQEATREI